jgi:hypothetical protein
LIELEEELEEENPTPPSIEKEVAPVKGKGKGRKCGNPLFHRNTEIRKYGSEFRILTC